MGSRPRVSETRVSTSSTTRREFGAAGATCTPTRLEAQRCLRSPGLLFHARPQKLVAAAGLAPARAQAQRILRPPCLLIAPRREKWCGRRESHPHGLSPTSSSGWRVCCFATSAKWSIHRDVRPAGCLTGAVRRFLRVGCVKWSRRKDSHLRSPGGAAFTGRCNCCSATPR